MRPPVLLSGLTLCLLTAPSSPYHAAPPPRHQDNHARTLPISSKTLFTLGALAVLGGASFYLGKHTGYHAAQKGGHPHGGGGYPFTGHQLNPYNHYNQYEVDPYLPYQGFAAGIYAQPIMAYQGRRRRRRGVDEGDQAAAATSAASPTAASPSAPSLVATSASVLAPSAPSTPAASTVTQKLQYDHPDSNLVPGIRVRGNKQTLDSRNAGSTKPPQVVTLARQAGGWTLPEGLTPPIDLYGLTHNKKYDAIQAEKATKILFPDDPKLAKRERRSTTSRKDIVVTSGLINVADDPYADLKTYRVPTKGHYYRDYKPVRFPSTSSEGHGPGTRDSSIEEEREPRITTTVSGTDPRERYGSSLYPFEMEQSLECRQAVEARNFEHFGLLMLESAMSEDMDGCGLSLVCEVGRVPLEGLPPKALGLRKLLTGRKPRGLDQDLWGALTQSLLTGLSHGDCGPRYPGCPAPPQHLLRVFADL